jgi:EmrB/QacA subfamily drug resistance transporter
MQASTQTTRTLGGLPYKWTVVIVTIFGLFMYVLDSTIVNIAIPRLQADFGAPLYSVQWVATGYSLAGAVATPLTPFLSEQLGLKRLYLLALAIFTLGSALCGLAPNLSVLILFRIVQGVGGAPLLPLAFTLIFAEFPPQERGTATGVLGIPVLLAPALGPTIGGYLVTNIGWPLIFYLNVPVGIVGLLMGFFFLRDSRSGGTSRFDLPGFVFSAIGLAAVLYGLSDVSLDGWGSTTVLGFLTGGVLSLAIFVVAELLTAHDGDEPLLDLRLFANTTFSLGSLTNILVSFCFNGGLFLIPLYLQNLRSQTAFEAGVILLPQALGSMVATVVGGQLVDRIGVKAVVMPGLLLLAYASWSLSSVSLDTPFAQYQLLLILRGFALGLATQPLTVGLLSNIKAKDLSQANSLNSVSRSLAGSVAVTVLSSLVSTQTSVHFAHLAGQVTATSRAVQLITQLQAALASSASSQEAAYTAAIQEIGNLLTKQANLLAINDAFFFMLAITIAAIVLLVLMPIPKLAPGASKPVLTE